MLQKAKQQAEAANQAKSAFIANISHDLCTPLSGLVGFAEITVAQLKTQQEREHTHYLVQSGYALLKLLNEIIEYAQIECDVLPPITVPYGRRRVAAPHSAEFSE